MNQNIIKGKLALITGASSGIGEAVAHKFAECGVNILLTARRLGRLTQTAEKLSKEYGITAYVRQLDVRESKAVSLMAQELEKSGSIPDILVNNAGLSAGKDAVYNADINDWDVMIDTNIKGFLYVSRAIIPLMVKRGRGHIINLGSIAGQEVYPGGNVYNATKFAVRALSQAMNIDLVNTNIRVCNIAPGAVNTEFSSVRYKGDKEKADATYDGFTPLLAADVADAILYVVNTPEHVNIQHLLIMPTAQRTVSLINKTQE